MLVLILKHIPAYILHPSKLVLGPFKAGDIAEVPETEYRAFLRPHSLAVANVGTSATTMQSVQLGTQSSPSAITRNPAPPNQLHSPREKRLHANPKFLSFLCQPELDWDYCDEYCPYCCDQMRCKSDLRWGRRYFCERCGRFTEEELAAANDMSEGFEDACREAGAYAWKIHKKSTLDVLKESAKDVVQ